MGTIDTASHECLGIAVVDVSSAAHCQGMLLITAVKAGAVEAWNAQQSDRCVEAGHFVKEVNGVCGNSFAMKHELGRKGPLRIKLVEPTANKTNDDKPPVVVLTLTGIRRM